MEVSCPLMVVQFLSTPSVRRATDRWQRRPRVPAISIHALREEGDSSTSGILYSELNFYPRPP